MAVDDTEKLEDGLGDWRFRAVARLAKDMPERGPGQPAHKAGALVAAIGELQAPTGERFTFPDFSGVALYLKVAIAGDMAAKELRDQVRPTEFVAPAGPYKTIPHDKIWIVFDLIEQSSLAATFSFQALEAYCNDIIQTALGPKRYPFARKGKTPEELTADEIEEFVSTADKLKTIVPDLLSVPSPKDNPVWSRFWELKRARDAITHLKYRDQSGAAATAAGGGSLTRTDPDFIFYKMVTGELSDLPRTAVEILDYFTNASGTPRWLRYPLSVYGMAITESPAGATTTLTIGPTT